MGLIGRQKPRARTIKHHLRKRRRPSSKRHAFWRRGVGMIVKKGRKMTNPCRSKHVNRYPSLDNPGETNLCLEALLVLMDNQTSKKRSGWLSYTGELRLVSLQLCNQCRHQLEFAVRVGDKTPRSLLENAPSSVRSGARPVRRGDRTDGDDEGRAGIRSRVLGVRATEVEWNLPLAELGQSEMFLAAATKVTFGFKFNETLQSSAVVWPRHLKWLNLGYRFDHDVSGVSWPPDLEELTFGTYFNHPIAGVCWPSQLKSLTFGCYFNKPLEGVVWPLRLQKLEFGDKFDQPVCAVRWPPDLHTMKFGSSFSQELQGTVWPRGPEGGLKRLTLGEGFSRQPVDTVTWPDTIQQLTLECITVRHGRSVRWPRTLKRLKVDLGLQRIEAVSWPVALEELEFGGRFNQRVDGRECWPLGLRRLAFGQSFNRPLDRVVWPIRLEELQFGCMFDQPLGHVDWPPDLKRLTFGDHFNQSISGVRWPETLEEISFAGWAFAQPLDKTAVWPVALRRLTLGRGVFSGGNNSPDSIELPPALRELEIVQDCKLSLKGVRWPRGLKMLTASREAVGSDSRELGLPAGCQVRHR